jgi:hypothetical protein
MALPGSAFLTGRFLNTDRARSAHGYPTYA